MRYVEPFSAINMTKSSTYGGKAASLGEMLSAGIPVPDGFAVAAQACRDFAGKKLSKDFEKEVFEAFKKLGASRVAVRSSAIAEDASDASWAGQLESYLNVTKETLLDSIVECWESIQAERAKSYAQDKQLSDDDLLVGVVVQKMVASEKSGVMFTANPITEDTNSMVIESVYGLGEVIVQGMITPDHWEVAKSPLKVSSFEIAVKDKMMIYQDGKNEIVEVPEKVADKATLREEEVLEVATIGLAVEKHYQKPQDIEWAYEGGQFYIVQSRPITTMKQQGGHV